MRTLLHQPPASVSEASSQLQEADLLQEQIGSLRLLIAELLTKNQHLREALAASLGKTNAAQFQEES